MKALKYTKYLISFIETVFPGMTAKDQGSPTGVRDQFTGTSIVLFTKGFLKECGSYKFTSGVVVTGNAEKLVQHFRDYIGNKSTKVTEVLQKTTQETEYKNSQRRRHDIQGVGRVTFAREALKHYIWVCLLETKEKVGSLPQFPEYDILIRHTSTAGGSKLREKEGGGRGSGEL
ncbi:hypothetical protein P5673_005405 [Acropora cervicornis]|uniref:Uncharacterized protein n=1 Tax=Acropora cervicornis TaxID=6130 RepID=A0AAD9QY62_ACRCE|nr:hypothetical protein P5673_005405 [Acropora cervicornis]